MSGALRRLLPSPLKGAGRRVLAAWRLRRLADWLQTHDADAFQRLTSSGLPAPVRDYVLSTLAAERFATLSSPLGDGIADTADVLIVSHDANPDVVKEVIELKRGSGPVRCVLLVRSLAQHDALVRHHVDRVHTYRGGVNLIRLLRRIKAKTVVLRAPSPLEGTLTRLFHAGRLIVRTNDVRVLFPDYDQSTLVAVAERFLLNKADGIYHIWTEETSRQLRSALGLSCLVKVVRPQCVPELGPAKRLALLSATDGRVHMAAINTPAARLHGRPIKGHWATAADVLDKWRVLLRSGIHLHAYFPSGAYQELPEFAEYVALQEQHDKFHLEESLPFDRLLVELTKYDLGYYHFDLDRIAAPSALREFGPNNLFTFLQAEVPIIASPSTVLPARVVREFGNGLVLGEDQLEGVSDYAARVGWASLRDGARRASAAFPFDTRAFQALVFGTACAPAGAQ